MDIREEIIVALKREIVGPSPNANYLDEETGEEVLLNHVHGAPKSRYGAGMLYPQQSINSEENDTVGDDQNLTEELSVDIDENVTNILDEDKIQAMNESGVNDEEPIGLANQYLPSAMGFTIRFFNNQVDDLIKLDINSAYYQKGNGKYPKKKVNRDNQIESETYKENPIMSDFWIRRPIKSEAILININSLFIDKKKSFDKIIKTSENGQSWLKLRIFNRSTKLDIDEGCLTYSFVLINDTKATTDDSANANNILYQNELILSAVNPNLIAPYQEKNSITDTCEEKELNLLYRKKRVFAIGHGTSVSWDAEIKDSVEKVNTIKTAVIPVYELPQVAPTNHVELSMLQLSDTGNWEKSKESLKELVSEYKKWILMIELEAYNSKEFDKYREAALANIEKCKACLERIQRGVNYLLNEDESSAVVKCFRWMNKSMLWQQQRSKTRQRKWIATGKSETKQFVLDGIDGTKIHSFPALEEFHNSNQKNGRWRPFQLAFILMCIDSILNPESEERKIVDLIWFPTGGGKTEAYLGLTAFSIFYRRMKGKSNWDWKLYGGTTVLMRYTLRLLTTQQYERAASLICACDLIRKENIDELGDETISIGLWVGGNSTPNDNSIARSQYTQLCNRTNAPYNFIVMKCPCCGAQIGKLEQTSQNIKIKGLKREDGSHGRILFQCENNNCEFSNIPLPLLVVDEYIYETAPTLLLGTVDKFAMLPWKKEAGKLFGFRDNKTTWSRIKPPELIIQDELHLIAGPLGTMVGLYETMIQTLCNDYGKKNPPFILSAIDFLPPKIIASSATISRSYEQVKSLYGIESKNQLNIFPAQGLEFGDTWFSEEKSIDIMDDNGKAEYPGRRYIGILASGYPSAQTSIVRAYSSVLQKIKELEFCEEIDYYWTLLGYFNSIRELGGASSLVYGDIRERLGQIQNRELIFKGNKRYINRIEELTSRISSAEIPETLKKLEQQFNRNANKSLDICLATNMVATGVDISRLGLMFIHGQPKTTAEYIQASSRVGRDLPDGPGLIFTLYSPSKPRDKSQYEQFQGYHSRIYSNVEPTSVTPFSINARERGLHAVLIGLVRHFSSASLRDNPEIEDEFESIVNTISDLIIKRCQIVDFEEVDYTKQILDKRIKFWRKGFQHYGDAGNYQILKQEGYIPLMYASGMEVRDEIVRENRSLATATSMRGVDTESKISIYSNEENDD